MIRSSSSLVSSVLGQSVPGDIENFIDVSQVSPLDLLWAAALIVGGVLLSGLARGLVKSRLTLRTNLPSGTVDIFGRTVGWAIISLGLVFAFPYLGVDVTPLFFLIVIVGVVLAVSGRPLVENYGAGVVLQAEGFFEPGDQIMTHGQPAQVVEVGSRVLKLETLDGRSFLVPNTSVLSGPVEVYTRGPFRRSELVLGLEYGTDLEAAREVLVAATRSAVGVVDDPPVEVFVSQFGESSIDFLIWFWHVSDLQAGFQVTDSVARALDRACKEHDLTIAFPQRTIWSGDSADA